MALMAIATYSDLKSSVADWLNRDDLTAVIPDFITMAEARFNRTLRTNSMITKASATASAETLALPADWLQTLTIQSSTVADPPLVYVTPQEYYEDALLAPTGDPKAYTIIGTDIYLQPAPASSYPVAHVYYQAIPALSDINTTNWLLTKAPDAYLYGALMQAEPYLKNDERVSLWATGLQNAIDALMLEDERTRRPTGALVQRKRSFG